MQMLSVVNRSINHKNLVSGIRKPTSFNIGTISSFWWKSEEKHNPDEVEKPPEASNDKKSLVPQFGDNSPKVSPILILPIPRRPIFPGFVSTLHVKDITTCEAITSNIDSGSRYIGLHLRKPPSNALDVPELITSIDDIYTVGTYASVQNSIKLEGGGLQLFVMGHRRVTLDNILSMGPPISGSVTHWPKRTVQQQSPAIKAYCNEVLASVR